MPVSQINQLTYIATRPKKVKWMINIPILRLRHIRSELKNSKEVLLMEL